MEPIAVDGREGEGGGQVLRTSLSLAAITGRAVRVDHVRAGRQKPGLLRQHLAAARAIAEVTRGELVGAELGSRALSFVPGATRAGDFRFVVGSAGSATLVLQTVLVPLLLADGSSRVVVEGGTHNPAAPPFEFLERSFLPLLSSMGAEIELDLERRGFHPAGGGRIEARIHPLRAPRPLELSERGAPGPPHVDVVVANLPRDIAEREWRAAQRVLHWTSDRVTLHEDRDSAGPGNVVTITLPFEHVTAVVTGFGERRRSSEEVGRTTAHIARRFLAHDAPVDEHLADQLLLPLAALAGGAFRTVAPSSHTTTNAAVIDRFLPGAIAIEEVGDEAATIRVRAR